MKKIFGETDGIRAKVGEFPLRPNVLKKLGEAIAGHGQGSGDVGALHVDERGLNALQEHLGRDVVAGNGKLDEGIACKDNESNLIVGEMVDEILDKHLALLQTRRNHILSQHGVADVKADDCFDAIALLARNLRSHLWTCQHHDEQGKCCLKQPELHRGTILRNVGHQFLEQGWITKLAELASALPPSPEPDECQQGNDQ